MKTIAGYNIDDNNKTMRHPDLSKLEDQELINEFTYLREWIIRQFYTIQNALYSPPSDPYTGVSVFYLKQDFADACDRQQAIIDEIKFRNTL